MLLTHKFFTPSTSSEVGDISIPRTVSSYMYNQTMDDVQLVPITINQPMTMTILFMKHTIWRPESKHRNIHNPNQIEFPIFVVHYSNKMK